MTIRKQPNGKWLCECYPSGREGKRVRKQFATKGEAIAYENFMMEEVNKKPWLGEKDDCRLLSEIIDKWHSLYGQTLADPKRLMVKLNIICSGLGDPIAFGLSAGDFTKYREARLKGEVRSTEGKLLSPVKARTVKLEQRNLSSVFGTLKKLGHRAAPNPLIGLPTFKVAEGELAFLEPDEIKRALYACAESQSESLLKVANNCMATGARWSETENLERHHISKYRITYTKTKSKKNRTVPISKQLYDELPKHRGKLFTPCRKAFEQTIKRAGIALPEVQCTHVLRYAFASHFMKNGGNLLVLRDILSDADI